MCASSPGSALNKSPTIGIKTYSAGQIAARQEGTVAGLAGLCRDSIMSITTRKLKEIVNIIDDIPGRV